MSKENLDRYGGAQAWEMYDLQREAAFRHLLESVTCGQCLRSVIPPDDMNPKEICWCRKHEEWFYCSDVPAEIDCEEFAWL